ncbi:hypothetical protein COL516b_002818 [Colletotrichum fioriniae]|nr:uncharacterized protein COL516b_002818 [Colletotrichum fioriniae]KAJ0309571.1 hypothetical protein COL516b_002818 [Colletotrichum fioriniae]
MHKSKSTYFTDLDMSRGNISLVLFREPINPFSGPKQFIMILGGAQCVWRKEIARYEKYELWTRVLSWDEKWIYLVTHFVKADIRFQEWQEDSASGAGLVYVWLAAGRQSRFGRSGTA